MKLFSPQTLVVLFSLFSLCIRAEDPAFFMLPHTGLNVDLKCPAVLAKLQGEMKEALKENQGEVPPEINFVKTGFFGNGWWPHPMKPKYFSMQHPSSWTEPYRWLRDKIRYGLQILHRHDYPTLDLDEAPVARWWAEQAFKVTPPPTALEAAVQPEDAATPEPFDKSVVMEHLMGVSKDSQNIGYLGHIENYPKQIEALLDEAADIEVQIAALNRVIAKDEHLYHISVEWDHWVRKGGKLVIEKTGREFGTRAKLVNVRNELVRNRKEVANRLRERIYDQAVMIKKVEIFTDELLDQMAINRGKELPPEYKAFLERSRKLYKEKTRDGIKDEFKPPTWAWEKLKNNQMKAEIASFWLNDIRLLKDKWGESFLKGAVDYFNALDSKTKRGMGLDDIKDLKGEKSWRDWTAVKILTLGASTWKDARWVRILGTAASLYGAGEVTGTFKGMIDLVTKVITSDTVAKLDCAEKKSEEDYQECAEKYLQDRFKSKFKNSRIAISKFFSDEGKAIDPALAFEIEDLVSKRNEYKADEYAKEIISQRLNQSTEMGTIDGKTFREGVIRAKQDDQFEAGVGIYLNHRFGPLYNELNARSAVDRVLKAKTENERADALKALKKLNNGNPMVETIEAFLKDRHIFIESGVTNNPDDDEVDAENKIEEAADKLLKEKPKKNSESTPASKPVPKKTSEEDDEDSNK